MSPTCTALKIISTIENISFILYVYYCHLNHLFCQILVGTPINSNTVYVVHVCIKSYYFYSTFLKANTSIFSASTRSTSTESKSIGTILENLLRCRISNTK